MTSDYFKKPSSEAELATLLHGLRYRGLAVGPDDAAAVATLFRHADGWSHQRRVRALKSLLARSDEERRVIDQLAPFLFTRAEKRAEPITPGIRPARPPIAEQPTSSRPTIDTPEPEPKPGPSPFLRI